MVAITIGGLGFQSSAIKTTTKIQALLAQLQKSILRSPPAAATAATAATAAAAGCRNISSWTRIEIPSVEFVRAHATAGRSISAPAMLHIQEQLTTPPGGGGGGGAICSGSGATAADTTGRRIWPTAAPLLEIVLRKVVQNKKNKQNNRHPTKTTTTTTTTDSAVSSSSSSTNRNKPIVLELGAGCGLIGMGLASYSGQFQRIIMTDTTTEWLERNVAHNRQQQQSQFVLDYSCCPMEVLALEWGRQRDHEFLRQKLTIMAANEEEERGFDDDDDGHDDSNKDNNNSNSNKSISSDAAHFSGDNSGGGGRRRRQSFFLDYIVGSDLLYNPASHSDLISTLNEFASSSSSSSSSSRRTKVLLAYPKRADNEAAFSALAQQRGFEVTISPLLVGRGGVNNNNNNHHQAEYSLMTLMKQTIK